ncbi:MAG: PIN domain-containing protein [Bacteroidetes bacterium]|jgi:predicted nucleic acid-binding protein|nr:PIN domain-containing protein [Bacteroidota bacterium]
MLVYLDTCSIQRPFDDQSQLRVALEAEAVLQLIQLAEQQQLELLGSEMLLVETEQNPHARRRRFALEVIALAVYTVETSEEIERRARAYDKVGIQPADAVHLASAVEAEADAFCTTDDQLLRRGREIDTGSTQVLSPIELIERIES